MTAEEVYIPKLRQDIQLLEGPAESDGTPTWTLYDPAANKYYKIGWLEFESLARFDRCRTAKELVSRLSTETTLLADEETIKHIVNFLFAHNLVRANDPAVLAYLEKERERQQKPLWKKVLHGYLYFTIPLFQPQRFLERTFPYIRFLFSANFFSAAIILLGYGVFLTLQRWDEFIHTFMSYMDLEGVALLVVTTIFVKIVHELSHAYTAIKYGVPVPTMGIALMVLYPVLYTETTNAWRLSSRRQRIYIAAAGIMGETVLASVALVLWHVLPPGLGQSIAFLVAVVSLLASLVMNMNPLMRFDGYYLFSDLSGFDNLQDRSFAFAKWRLRHLLWGWNDPAPEILIPERQHFLEIFGFSTWIYRFSLFLGIALLVYHIFPKPFGLALMLVEIGFFIVSPILREITVWKKEFSRISQSVHGRVVLAFAATIVISLFIPWQRSVGVPAVLHAAQYKILHAPAPSHVDEIRVKQGQNVQADDVLFMLSSPKLEHDIEIAREKLALIRNVRDREQFSRELVNLRPTIHQEIEAAEEELGGLLAQKELLTVKASFPGKIADMNSYLHEGLWVNSAEPLALLVSPREVTLTGYVDEQDISRIHENARGFFYPDSDPLAKYDVSVFRIEKTDTSSIFWPELSSLYGGPIPADRGPGGDPIARYTLYSVKFKLDKRNTPAFPKSVVRGFVRLKADPVSPVKHLLNKTFSLFLRESGL